MNIVPVRKEDGLWPKVASLFPEAAAWLDSPDDDGDYRFLAAMNDDGEFLGASVIEIGTLYFGPLAGVPAGFLENIEVLGPHRRQGIGKSLLRAILQLAWDCGCESVRSTVDYDNVPAISLYRSQGLGFLPEEDPDAAEKDLCYSIVAIKPERIAEGYGTKEGNLSE